MKMLDNQTYSAGLTREKLTSPQNSKNTTILLKRITTCACN